MKDYLLCFKQQKSRRAGRERAAPEGSLGDVPLVLMTCVVHYGVTRDWRQRGGLWEGLSPSATEGGPPLWDCQRWGLLVESSCPKNTHTYAPKSQVKTPNRWLCLISASLNLFAIEQNAELFSDLTDWQPSMNSQTDAPSSILTPRFVPQEGLPSSHWDVT